MITEEQIAKVMSETGMEHLQALNHLRCRRILQQRSSLHVTCARQVRARMHLSTLETNMLTLTPANIDQVLNRVLFSHRPGANRLKAIMQTLSWSRKVAALNEAIAFHRENGRVTKAGHISAPANRPHLYEHAARNIERAIETPGLPEDIKAQLVATLPDIREREMYDRLTSELVAGLVMANIGICNPHWERTQREQVCDLYADLGLVFTVDGVPRPDLAFPNHI